MNAPVDMDHARIAATTPLDRLDPSNPAIFRDDAWQPYFARLRAEAPVHWCPESMFGPYWSVTTYKDIMQCELAHKVLSSDSLHGGISIRDRDKALRLPMFIAMDPPQHDDQRKVVQPIVAPDNLAKMEGIIRARAIEILEGLPRNETFNWVDRVSIELTVSMLATLFDFPQADRLWAIVGLIILLSVLLHGLMVTPIMRGLDRKHGRDPDAPEATDPDDEPDAPLAARAG